MTVKLSMAGFAAVSVLIFGGAACTGTETPSSPPSSGSQESESEADRRQQQELNDTEAENGSQDVDSFAFDDRSEYGVTDIWVNYSLTNGSSKTSDYIIDYEIVDKSTNERVYNSTIYETNVAPGQTTRGEDPVSVETTSGHEINITKVERTASP